MSDPTRRSSPRPRPHDRRPGRPAPAGQARPLTSPAPRSSPAPCSAAAPRAGASASGSSRCSTEIGAANDRRPRAPRPRHWSSTPPASPTRPSWSSCSASSTPPSTRLQRTGRVVVLGTPPAGPARPARHTAQRALEGFTRSLGKEIGRGIDRAARLRRRGRRGGARLHPALPALAPLGLRLRPGGRSRQGGDEGTRPRLGAPARRQGGAGHRRLARHRRGDRRRHCTATAPRSSASTCPQAAADLRRGRQAARRRDARARHHRPPTRPLQIAAATPRRGRRRRPQRRRHPRPHDREDARGPLELADGDQPLQRGADQRRAARVRTCCDPTAASSASPR